MSAVSPVFSIFPIIIALFTTFLLSKFFRVGLSHHSRFKSIDGLRGYLALFVFLHHSMIWFFYLKLGRWQLPPSNLYINFGKIGVALFFIITGFLFSFKLLDARKNQKSINWSLLFFSRVFRLVPLYFVVILILSLIVLVLTHFALVSSMSVFTHTLLYWFGFTVFGHPDINGVFGTWIIMAGVAWSLPYEWFYYFSLPLFGLFIGLRVPVLCVLISVASVYLFYVLKFEAVHLYYFLVGILSAFFVGNRMIKTLATHKISDYVLAILLLVSFLSSELKGGKVSLIIFFIFFVAITNGNTLFGILTNKISIFLGEMGYSLYLLHGIILFTVFKFVFGFSAASSFSPLGYWVIVSICASILVVCSFATYTWIEAPAMRCVKYFSNSVRSRVQLNI
ncbi:MAG: acyltransferase family protein [Gammaproteobacteria bacterium]